MEASFLPPMLLFDSGGAGGKHSICMENCAVFLYLSANAGKKPDGIVFTMQALSIQFGALL